MRKFSQLLLLASCLSLLGACGGGGGGSTGGGGQQATQFSVSGPAASSTGIAFSFTVAALDAANNVVSSYSGTVHFTSSDARAVLPADSTLVGGTKTFSATFTNAGLQTINSTDTASASLHGSLMVTAAAAEFPVTSFGAKGDGHTDDTAAIQSAINAAGAAGGGSVVLGMARYFTSGSLVVPRGVVLCGTVEGPFDVGGATPAATTIAPTILITNTSGPFLTLQGIGSGVTDLLFHYPNQVPSSAAAPNVYPYTILVTAPGTKVARSTVTNAYDFLDIESGRVLAQNLFIGALHIGVNIDHAYDHVTLRNILNQVFWDVVAGGSVPSSIDNWVMANATALVVGRVDGLEIHDFFLFIRHAGILLTDSPDLSQNPRCGYGTGSNFDLDTVNYGIVVNASQSPGYKFTNTNIGSGIGGQAAVQVGTGSLPPKILINGTEQRGIWAIYSGGYPSSGPDTIVTNILP